MTDTRRRLTPAQQQAALNAVAAWMGPQIGHYDETPCDECADTLDCEHRPFKTRTRPAPTGQEAAHKGLGPMLLPEWDWPTGGPTPTIILEGGPEEWAYWITEDDTVRAALDAAGIHTEPYASYALCLYPA